MVVVKGEVVEGASIELGLKALLELHDAEAASEHLGKGFSEDVGEDGLQRGVSRQQ